MVCVQKFPDQCGFHVAGFLGAQRFPAEDQVARILDLPNEPAAIMSDILTASESQILPNTLMKGGFSHFSGFFAGASGFSDVYDRDSIHPV